MALSYGTVSRAVRTMAVVVLGRTAATVTKMLAVGGWPVVVVTTMKSVSQDLKSTLVTHPVIHINGMGKLCSLHVKQRSFVLMSGNATK